MLAVPARFAVLVVRTVPDAVAMPAVFAVPVMLAECVELLEMSVMLAECVELLEMSVVMQRRVTRLRFRR